jgi:hypothetical protein
MATSGARHVLWLSTLLAALAVARPGRAAGGADDASRVAVKIASLLRASGVPAKVVSAGIAIDRTDLRIEVRDPRTPGDGRDVLHVHVAAQFPGATSGGLDACTYGIGSTSEERVASAAESYVVRAFPPVYALVRGEATAAQRFGGTEPFAVPGFRGFLGPLLVQGDAGSATGEALTESRLFEGLRLPDDGRAHLLKVVLLAEDGTFVRTLELDGNPTQVTEAPWSGVPAPANPVLAVRFAAFRFRDAISRSEARATALVRLAKRERWLFDGVACPLDVAPKELFPPSSSDEVCRGGRLLDCVEECKAGVGSSCYVAALETERTGEADPIAQALFIRACRLGVASGCTNAAAALRVARGKPGGLAPKNACPERVFEAVCERSGDPWACTMLGNALAGGDHMRRDVRRARSVLSRACARDEQDPACIAARAILEQLEEPTVRGRER